MQLMQGLMVPLMMLTLAAVVGSQISGVGGQLPSLAAVRPSTPRFWSAVVVSQTLVELIGMVIFVRLIPRLIPAPAAAG